MAYGTSLTQQPQGADVNSRVEQAQPWTAEVTLVLEPASEPDTPLDPAAPGGQLPGSSGAAQ